MKEGNYVKNISDTGGTDITVGNYYKLVRDANYKSIHFRDDGNDGRERERVDYVLVTLESAKADYDSIIAQIDNLTKKRDTLIDVIKELTPKPPVLGDKFVKIGEYYDDTTYIVCSPELGKYSLISLDTGERWIEPVSDISNVFGNTTIKGFRKAE